jgi:CBS domain-containing protein
MRLRRNIAAGNDALDILQITRPPYLAYPDQTLAHALYRMNADSVRQLSVISRDKKTFLGIITMTDIVEAQTSAMPPLDLTEVPSLEN